MFNFIIWLYINNKYIFTKFTMSKLNIFINVYEDRHFLHYSSMH